MEESKEIEQITERIRLFFGDSVEIKVSIIRIGPFDRIAMWSVNDLDQTNLKESVVNEIETYCNYLLNPYMPNNSSLSSPTQSHQ